MDWEGDKKRTKKGKEMTLAIISWTLNDYGMFDAFFFFPYAFYCLVLPCAVLFIPFSLPKGVVDLI